MSDSSSASSGKQRRHRSAWRKGSVGRNRRASVEGGISMCTTRSSVSLYSSSTKLDHNRRSSTGTTHPPNNSSSTSADKPSRHLHDELKDQIEENFYLTQEVLDLKMRLANAMAQIDAEKHTNRLQAEQISQLCDDNDELKCFLNEAYKQIAELAKRNGNDGRQNNTEQSLHNSASSTRPNEGWLHRVATTISMASNSTSSSSSSSDNQYADSRKDTDSQFNIMSTMQSSMTLMERSTRRLSLLSLGSSLAEEELHTPPRSEIRSSMYPPECRHSSLSTFREEDMEEKHNAKESEDDWLDGGIALPGGIEQATFAARNA